MRRASDRTGHEARFLLKHQLGTHDPDHCHQLVRKDPLTPDVINLAEVQAEVRALFELYEAALLRHDVDLLNAMFWHAPQVVRYGLKESQRGFDELMAFRATGPAIGPNRRLMRTVVTSFGHDLATVMTEFQDDADPRIGRQSQTWVRFKQGWRIVAAHVSHQE